MRTIKRVSVPTGDILIVQGEHGPLEMLSLGDYGKDKNLKADFLGLGREIDGVPHGGLLPLEEKWVLTISSQYGCSMGCRFCDVPRVGPGHNATAADLLGQIQTGRDLHPEVKTTARLNIHFARMGEPTFNTAVLACAERVRAYFPGFHVHPVVSTMMPRKNRHLRLFLRDWMALKNGPYEGEAGLQLSINSTDEWERMRMFRGNALTLDQAAELLDGLKPRGRKITLNFALAGYEIAPAKLLRHFSPEDYLVKITPMHETASCGSNGIHTPDGYVSYRSYREPEEKLKAAGYEVIVFVPSREEDESRITCGNAILTREPR
jgi:23S rRNA (adenine2503-C2)-methyltransferase